MLKYAGYAERYVSLSACTFYAFRPAGRSSITKTWCSYKPVGIKRIVWMLFFRCSIIHEENVKGKPPLLKSSDSIPNCMNSIPNCMKYEVSGLTTGQFARVRA